MAYTLEGRKCGTIRFVPDAGTIQNESLNMSSKVTSYPIEDGSNINDHVVKEQSQFTVSGVIVGGASQEEALKEMREKRDIITYTGRRRLADLVITSLTFDTNSKNKNGCGFKATFQQVRITSAEYVDTGAAPLMSQQDAGKGKAKKTSQEGLKTTLSDKISNDAYVKDTLYNYNNKQAPSAGPSQRSTPSYNGIS